MSSPFPGMDPYLEGNLWMDFHHGFLMSIKFQLIPKLGARYYPFVSKYFLVDDAEIAISTDGIYPDIEVAESKVRGTPHQRGSALPAAPVQVSLVMPRRVSHARLEIRDSQKRRLVTVLEVLSPTSKRGSGRKQFIKKRQRILMSNTRLVEIDLLRKGKRVPMRNPLPEAPYYVMVSRHETRPVSDVWPIQLVESLPTIPVPLLQKDHDIVLDLQEALRSNYEASDFSQVIDYGSDPDEPLSPPDGKRVNEILGRAGLR